MATPTKRSFRLTGADGRTLHGELRSAGGVRPALVICGGPRPELADRLARAGFAVVSFELAGSTDLDVVLDALRRGSVGVAAEKYGLIGLDTGAAMALQRTARDERVRALVTVASARLNGGEALRERWLELAGSDAAVEQVVGASLDWLARHLS